MKILVTGAKGMLGQDLCPVLEDEGYEVIETGREEFDITDKTAVNNYLQAIMPDIVIHCAAYTAVDKAEEDSENAMLVNAFGTENIAEFCGKNDIALVYISTDYVFDGEKKEPYKPDDNTNPLNVYGLSKLKGEEAVQKYCRKFYIVRTSWLYGHHGRNFAETIITKALEGQELKVVDDQIGCPTWTADLASGIVELLNKPYGIYHLCGGGQTSWYGFAKEILSLCKIDAQIVPCLTKDYPRAADRAHYSVMDNGKMLRNWKSALKEYIELRGA